MFPKHKQTLHLQKAVSGWEIKWSKSHQYLPSLVSTCLPDTILKSWSIPHTQPSCQHDACACVRLCVCVSTLPLPLTTGYQKNAERLTKSRGRKQWDTFYKLFFFLFCTLVLISTVLTISVYWGSKQTKQLMEDTEVASSSWGDTPLSQYCHSKNEILHDQVVFSDFTKSSISSSSQWLEDGFFTSPDYIIPGPMSPFSCFKQLIPVTMSLTINNPPFSSSHPCLHPLSSLTTLGFMP